MIIQPYAFKGSDFDEVYAQARDFIERLHTEAGISVELPDGFRSVTKHYPDHDTTMTVVEVFPTITDASQINLVEKVFIAVTLVEDEEEDDEPHSFIPQALGHPKDDYDPFLDTDDLP
jgi:hypothetical protein